MQNDYECPRCHNIFPSANKILHDAKCTEKNPVPLDESRLEAIKNQDNNNKNNDFKEIPQQIPNQEKKEEINPPNFALRKPPSGEFPEVFECNICHQMFMEKERKDHMLCHDLEKEEKKEQENFEASPEQIEEQKRIEKQIEINKRMKEQINNNRNNDNNYNYNRPNNRNNNSFFPNLGDSDIEIRNNNENRGNHNNNRPNNRNNDPFSSNLGDSDMDMGGIGFGGSFLRNFQNAINQQQRRGFDNYTNNNNQNRPNRQDGQNSSSNTYIQFISSGPNGRRIVRNYQSGGGNSQNDLNRFMNMNPRRNISFIDFQNNLFGDIFSTFFENIGNRDNPTDEEIINELPETTIEDVSKLDQEKKNCIICLENFKNGDKAIILPCIHIFHNECIKKWLQTQDSCPICKHKLTRENMESTSGYN